MQRVTKTQLSFLLEPPSGETSTPHPEEVRPQEKQGETSTTRRSKYDLIRRNKYDLIHCLYAPAHGRRRKGQQKTTYQQHIAKMIHGNASVEEEAMRERPRVEELHGTKL